jgi:hypothetical protein
MINLIKKIFGLKKTKTITPAVSTPKPVLAEVKAEPKPSVKPVSPAKDETCIDKKPAAKKPGRPKGQGSPSAKKPAAKKAPAAQKQNKNI